MGNLIRFFLILFAILIAAALLNESLFQQNCYAEQCYWCESDFNDDGDVDGYDLSLFSNEYGSTNCCTGISEDAIYVSITNPAAADLPEAGLTPSFPTHSIS